MAPQYNKSDFDEIWYWYLTGEFKQSLSPELVKKMKRMVALRGFFPGAPRCLECNSPMTGLFSLILSTKPATFSPRFCNTCERIALQLESGAEVALSMLFVDMRGSTALAEKHTPAEFSQLIKKFYKGASDVLIKHNAMVNRLIGDQMIGLFVPRFAGKDHAKKAISAGLELLDAIRGICPVGGGVHSGTAYVGVVGSKEGVHEIAVLGSAANLAARLSSQAGAGELLVSDECWIAAEMNFPLGEQRLLSLKGIQEPVAVHALSVLEPVPVVAM
jgi:adenylate cyclase